MVTCRPFEGGRGFCGGALGACGARPMATVAAIFSWMSWALALTSSFLTFWSVGSAASIIPSIIDDALNFHYGLWTFCAGGAPVVNSGCFGYGGHASIGRITASNHNSSPHRRVDWTHH